MERTGYADFFELRSRISCPIETTNYVPIILAMTIMTKNAAEYGLEVFVPDSPLEYDSLEMSSPVHIALDLRLTNTPVAELQALNPALFRGLAPAVIAARAKGWELPDGRFANGSCLNGGPPGASFR